MRSVTRPRRAAEIDGEIDGPAEIDGEIDVPAEIDGEIDGPSADDHCRGCGPQSVLLPAVPVLMTGSGVEWWKQLARCRRLQSPQPAPRGSRTRCAPRQPWIHCTRGTEDPNRSQQLACAGLARIVPASCMRDCTGTAVSWLRVVVEGPPLWAPASSTKYGSAQVDRMCVCADPDAKRGKSGTVGWRGGGARSWISPPHVCHPIMNPRGRAPQTQSLLQVAISIPFPFTPPAWLGTTGLKQQQTTTSVWCSCPCYSGA